MKNCRHCSFCSKDEHQIVSLIDGMNGMYVCGECVDSFNHILLTRTGNPAAYAQRMDEALAQHGFRHGINGEWI